MSPPPGQYTFRLPDELAAEWERIDGDNTRWLGEVLDARGWPGRTLVGEDGAEAAWLLAQHADRDPARQRAFLQALRDAVDNGEASPAQLAYLEDRVRVNAGQPQLYGTQFTVTEGEFGPRPIEDPHRLDERRAQAAWNRSPSTTPACEPGYSGMTARAGPARCRPGRENPAMAVPIRVASTMWSRRPTTTGQAR